MIIPNHYYVVGRQLSQKLSICNPKPDLNNINAHSKFGQNPQTFTQVFIQKQKYE